MIDAGDLYLDPTATGTFMDSITPARARGSDADNSTLAHLLMLVTGYWHSSAYTTEPFASAVESIVPDAAAGKSCTEGANATATAHNAMVSTSTKSVLPRRFCF